MPPGYKNACHLSEENHRRGQMVDHVTGYERVQGTIWIRCIQRINLLINPIVLHNISEPDLFV